MHFSDAMQLAIKGKEIYSLSWGVNAVKKETAL